MKIKNRIKSGALLVIIIIGLLPSSIYAVDNGFDNDFGNDMYDGDYLFNFINESENNSDDDFGSDDLDFNSASEDPNEDIGDIFGDLFGEVDDDFGSDDIDFNAASEEPDEDIGDIFGDLFGEVNDDVGSDDIDFNSASEDPSDDISDIFGDLLGEVENSEDSSDDIDFNSASEDPSDDISDIFGNLIGDIENEDTIEDVSMNVQQQLYPNCKAIDDMLYGYSMVNISKFIDIEESLYKNDIIRIENAGVIDGRSANTFDPYEPITRAEFLSVAMKAHCIDFSAEGTHDFSDVEKSGWKARVVSKAISEEIISGSTNAVGQKIFRPNDPITRMEVLAILLNMTKKEIPWDRESPYIDIASQQWQKNYVTRWNELGLFMPYKTHNKFYPNRYIMREHIGTILYRVVQLYR